MGLRVDWLPLSHMFYCFLFSFHRPFHTRWLLAYLLGNQWILGFHGTLMSSHDLTHGADSPGRPASHSFHLRSQDSCWISHHRRASIHLKLNFYYSWDSLLNIPHDHGHCFRSLIERYFLSSKACLDQLIPCWSFTLTGWNQRSARCASHLHLGLE